MNRLLPKYGIFTLTLMLAFFKLSFAQLHDDEFDKCGYNSKYAKSHLEALGDHWGYSYDSLIVDLIDWSYNPYVTIDSLGASVQNRGIWQLTITSNDTFSQNKQTVFIHARTHPGEVQSWWVTEQVINQLTSESEIAQLLRENCVFYIIPMYNPDGVELELPRYNANGVDLESNWDSNPVEPEVVVLRNRFTELMASNAPIKVAMNMHSAYGMHRFFVFHDSTGTSPAYSLLEQDYIEGVRFYYFNGIEPWYYRITWTSGTPPYYPESWFWLNHQESVMALTYEDWNDPLAFNFDSTANAILHGIADYLNISPSAVKTEEKFVSQFELFQNYPNPFNPSTTIRYTLSKTSSVTLKVYNVAGEEIRTLVNKVQTPGIQSIVWDGRNDLGEGVSSGIYFYRLQIDDKIQNKKMTLLR